MTGLRLAIRWDCLVKHSNGDKWFTYSDLDGNPEFPCPEHGTEFLIGAPFNSPHPHDRTGEA